MLGTMRTIRVLAVLACQVCGTTPQVCSAYSSQETREPTPPEHVPSDICLLTIQAEPHVSVTLDGKDYGKQRQIRIAGLAPSEWHEVEFTAVAGNNRSVEKTLLVSGGRMINLPITPDNEAVETVPLTGHSSYVSAIAFSRDGSWTVTGGGDGAAILWESNTGKLLRVLVRSMSEIRCVSVAPDNAWVLTAAYNDGVRIWNPLSGAEVRYIPNNSLCGAAVSPDGHEVLIGTWDGECVLHRTDTGEEAARLNGHTLGVGSAAYSSDGRLILTGAGEVGGAGEAAIWDRESRRKLHNLQGIRGEVGSVAFGPNGRLAVTGGTTNFGPPTYTGEPEIYLWNTESGKKVRELKASLLGIQSVAFRPDGLELLAGPTPPDAKAGPARWEVNTGRRLAPLPTVRPGEDFVMRLAYQPVTDNLFVGYGLGHGVLWDRAVEKPLSQFESVNRHFTFHKFSKRGPLLLAAALWQWNLNEGGLTPFTDSGTALGSIRCTAIHPDRTHAIAAGLTKEHSPQIRVLNLANGKFERELNGARYEPANIAFSQDGRRFVTAGGYDHSVQGNFPPEVLVWDFETGQILHELAGHTETVYAVDYRDDGEQILTGSDNEIMLWNAKTGEAITKFSLEETGCRSAAFLRGGLALFGDNYGHVRCFDLNAQTELWSSQQHGLHWIDCIDVGSNGRYAVTSGHDGKAVLWDVQQGKALRTFRHENPLASVALAGDEDKIVATSGTGPIVIWDVATGDKLAQLIALDSGKDHLVFTPEGLFDGSRLGREKVAFRIGSGLDVVPVDRFFQDFYHPGLLAGLLAGQRPTPLARLASDRPPRIKILLPTEDKIVDVDEIDFEVEVAEQGGGISGPWLWQNGTRAATRDLVRRHHGKSRQTFSVRLADGENRIEFRAATADGSWESEPAIRTLVLERDFKRPNLYVIALGINRYRDESVNLRFAVRDAESVAALFERRASQLYEKSSIFQLLDADCTTETIKETLEEIASQATPADTLIFFAAGHGVTLGQRYYFIPHEFQFDRNQIDESVRRYGLPVDELGEMIASVPALKRVMVFDTCQSGSAIRLGRAARNPFAFRGAIERLSRSQGVFVLAAAAATEEAAEAAELDHGLLTYTLLAGLNAAEGGPLADQAIQPASSDHVVDVLEWFNYASGHVPRLTQRYLGRSQDIQLSAEGTGFPVLPLFD